MNILSTTHMSFLNTLAAKPTLSQYTVRGAYKMRVIYICPLQSMC